MLSRPEARTRGKKSKHRHSVAPIPRFCLLSYTLAEPSGAQIIQSGMRCKSQSATNRTQKECTRQKQSTLFAAINFARKKSVCPRGVTVLNVHLRKNIRAEGGEKRWQKIGAKFAEAIIRAETSILEVEIEKKATRTLADNPRKHSPTNAIDCARAQVSIRRVAQFFPLFIFVCIVQRC